jgi:Arc/MetJ family transcription regulator
MRTTLNIDDELLDQATRLTGIREKTSLVELGLQTLIATESAKRLAKLGGPRKDWPTYPAEDLRAAEILSLLQALPLALSAEHVEVLQFIDSYRLMGRGLGYVDGHLLAAAHLSAVSLWTLDKRLNEAASMLGLDHRPP